MLEKFLGRFEN